MICLVIMNWNTWARIVGTDVILCMMTIMARCTVCKISRLKPYSNVNILMNADHSGQPKKVSIAHINCVQCPSNKMRENIMMSFPLQCAILIRQAYMKWGFLENCTCHCKILNDTLENYCGKIFYNNNV